MHTRLEHISKPVISGKQFARRMVWYTIYGVLFIAFSLVIGAVGYHHYGNIGWVDSFYNAAMICAGMGPVTELNSDSAKIFATIYAIYSGVAFLTSVGVIFAPLIHRLLHRLHAPLQDK